VKVELGSCSYAPTRGIRMAGPRGTAVTGGVRSPLCDCARCHVCTRGDQPEPFKRPLRLTTGHVSISYFQSFSITWSLKFELVSLPMSKILQILQIDSLRDKKELYFLDQLQNPIVLRGINYGTHSNSNIPWILKGSKPFWKNMINSLKFHLHMI
jgi:hypothetical protein